MPDATWLEPDPVFEGVGASVLNPRFDWIVEEHGPRPDPTPVTARSHPALFAALVAAAGPAAVPFEGHDGSHYQWDQGRAAGALPPVDLVTLAQASRIVWWKASQSISYVDPSFALIWLQARALFRYRVAYHWLSSVTDPEQQAAHLCKVLDAVGGPREGDAVMIDSEEAGVTAAMCVAFAEWVEHYYDRPIITDYTGLYVDGGRIWNSDELREGNYGHRPMHVAAYVTEDRLDQLMTARQAKPYDAWQYWSGGPVPGVVGRGDMSSRVRFAAYDVICLKQAKPKPQPEPKPEPTPEPVPLISGDDMTVLDAPVRAWDSRPGSPQGGNGKHNTGETFFADIIGKVAAPANARGVIASLTVIDAEATGFLTVWGPGGRPETSNVNFSPGEQKNTLAVVPLSGGAINVFTSARCNVIIDVQGWSL